MKSPTILLTLTTVVSASGQVPKGLKIQWVGHSFHAFLPNPVAKLAKEAGIQGHVNLGMDMLGGSTPCEHWNRAYPEAKITSGWIGGGMGKTPGGKDLRKVIDEGTADVLTLASQATMPEPCITKFVQKAFEKRKQLGMRVMVQETWLPLGERGSRDNATITSLKGLRTATEEPYKSRMRNQLQGLQAKTAANFTTLVPAWDLVIGLRELVLKGGLPGVAKQSNLFADALGHPRQPLSDAASYLWFAALYGINPQGTKALGNPQMAPILQKLAWDTLKKEPLRGAAAT